MLCLKIHPPGHLVFKPIVMLLQQLNRLCVGHPGKIRLCHMMQTIQQPLVNKIVKEIHLLRRVLQHIIDDIFEHSFCQIHIVLEIRKCHLRLDHPELSRMACRVGILGTEGPKV